MFIKFVKMHLNAHSQVFEKVNFKSFTKSSLSNCVRIRKKLFQELTKFECSTQNTLLLNGYKYVSRNAIFARQPLVDILIRI